MNIEPTYTPIQGIELTVDTDAIEKELSAQETQKTVLNAYFAGAAFFCAVIAYNVSFIVGFVAFFACVVVRGLRSDKMAKEHAQRIERINWMRQIKPIFVYSLHESDRDVVNRFQYAIQMLSASGNEANVPVYRMMYRDHITVCHTAKSGAKRTARDTEYPATETWNEYQNDLKIFIKKMVNDHAKTLRANEAGDTWTDIHYYGQYATN